MHQQTRCYDHNYMVFCFGHFPEPVSQENGEVPYVLWKRRKIVFDPENYLVKAVQNIFGQFAKYWFWSELPKWKEREKVQWEQLIMDLPGYLNGGLGRLSPPSWAGAVVGSFGNGERSQWEDNETCDLFYIKGLQILSKMQSKFKPIHVCSLLVN